MLKRLIVAGVSLLSAGLRLLAASPDTAGPSALARWHFVGSAAVNADPNGQLFRSNWNEPVTQKLVQETLDKLSAALRQSASTTPATNRPADPMVRPLLDDLLTAETFAEWRGTPGQPLDWAVAVQINPDRLNAWQTGVPAWFASMQGSPAKPSPLDGTSGWQANLGATLGNVSVTPSGDWMIIGGGGMSAARSFADKIKSTKRPGPALTNVWIAAEANVPRLAGWLKLSSPDRWPHVHVTLGSHGPNVRTLARFGFKDPPLSPLPNWQVPISLIREDAKRVPLASMLAARGFGPLLDSWTSWKALGLKNTPAQGYIWSQAQVPFQTYYALHTPDVTNTLRQVYQRLPSVLSTNLINRKVFNLSFDTNHTEVMWTGLPIVAPTLSPANDPAGPYILGKFFPMAPVSNAPPPALISQITDHKNLVFFEWEYLAARIPQWNALWQMSTMASGTMDFTGNSTAQAWMFRTTTNFTDSGTEIVLDSPKVLSLKHTSPLGLNALAIVTLSRWLDNPLFPAWERPAFQRRVTVMPIANPTAKPAK